MKTRSGANEEEEKQGSSEATGKSMDTREPQVALREKNASGTKPPGDQGRQDRSKTSTKRRNSDGKEQTE